MIKFVLWLTSLLSTVFNAYVFTVLWGWFAVVIFGAAPITIPMALGIGLLVRFYTIHIRPDDLTEDSVNHHYLLDWLKPLMFLLAGFIYKQFM